MGGGMAVSSASRPRPRPAGMRGARPRLSPRHRMVDGRIVGTDDAVSVNQPRGSDAERDPLHLCTRAGASVRLVTFEHEGRRALGAVDGERVDDLRFPGDMVAFVTGGNQALAWAAI